MHPLLVGPRASFLHRVTRLPRISQGLRFYSTRETNKPTRRVNNLRCGAHKIKQHTKKHLSTTTATPITPSEGGGLLGFLDYKHCIAPPWYTKWHMVPASFLVQTSIGSVYAWSVFNTPLTTQIGVLASASSDWALTEVVPIFGAAALSLGVTTALLGSWAERVGPRKVAATAAVCWAGGLGISSVGVYLHMLPLVYVGYGIFGGIGWGLGYISPVSTLMKWFPDRRGLATGLGLTAFGGGAIIAAPLNEWLMKFYRVMPEHLGHSDAVNMITEGGKRFVETSSGLQEVMTITAGEVVKFPGMLEGVYLVGSGSGGVPETFLTLSVLHFCFMFSGSLVMKVPPPGYNGTDNTKIATPGVSATPTTTKTAVATTAAAVAAATDAASGSTTPTTASSTQNEKDNSNQHVVNNASGGDDVASATEAVKGEQTEQEPEHAVTVSEALKMHQTYLLWVAVFGNALAGATLISCAKGIMTDVFCTVSPALIGGGILASYVSMLSAANMTGRLGWASISDYLGRKNTYMLFGLGAPIAACLPLLTSMVASGELPVDTALPLFIMCTVVVMTFYGGLFSVLPAYLADVFGQKHVGAHHGRLLTAWSMAASVGPLILSTLREQANNNALVSLCEKIDPTKFEKAFGAKMSEMDMLVEAKTVTIAKLMDIAPPGTIDPTPMLYDTTLYTMSGFIFLAFLSNACMTPVRLAKIASVLKIKKM